MPISLALSPFVDRSASACTSEVCSDSNSVDDIGSFIAVTYDGEPNPIVTIQRYSQVGILAVASGDVGDDGNGN